MTAPSIILALALVSPETISEWLESWDLERAGRAVAELETQHAREPGTEYLRGNLLFLQGAYDDAKRTLDDAARRSSGNPAILRLRDLARATGDLTRGFEEHASEHFIVRHPKGIDEILVPYALDALEAARRALAEDFGFPSQGEGEGKLRVEIYADTADLAVVSTLTEKEIETSGTIALCKWNRLMIVSPRALVRGYPWLDTLAHEYTHYVVTRVSQNRVPIWLHEGIAKYEETRWRVPGGQGLPPTLEHLLAAGLRSKRLVSFASMHPSLAKLPSQEQAQLAFAEVYTAVEYLVKTRGWKGVRRIVERIGAGISEERAIAEVAGMPFPAWERGWRGYLAKQGYKLRPGLAPRRMAFRPEGTARSPQAAKKQDEEDLPSGMVEKARRFARLGGLLRARGQTAAAIVEYEKAAGELRGKEPVLQQKLARAYLELGQLAPAKSAAEAGLALFPDLPGLHVTLAEVALKSGEMKTAQEHFIAANRLNPFDPSVHCSLADLWRGEPRGEREYKACVTLGGR